VKVHHSQGIRDAIRMLRPSDLVLSETTEDWSRLLRS
jgi:hypothetical protein